MKEGIRVEILTAEVPPAEREAWYARHLRNGMQVCLAHPKLCSVGLDLLDFPVLLFYEKPGTRRIRSVKPASVVGGLGAGVTQSPAWHLEIGHFGAKCTRYVCLIPQRGRFSPTRISTGERSSPGRGTPLGRCIPWKKRSISRSLRSFSPGHVLPPARTHLRN